LVTGDEDLLALSAKPDLGELKIVTTKQFLAKILPQTLDPKLLLC